MSEQRSSVESWGLREQLADLVRASGRAQNLLARDAGLSEKHVSQMLTGRVSGSLDAWDRLLAARKPVTAPAGSEDAGLVRAQRDGDTDADRSEDAGLVLSAEEVEALRGLGQGQVREVVERIVAARVEAARAEALRDAARDVGGALQNEVGGHTSTYSVRTWLNDRAARIARTPPPAGDARGSQEASKSPVSHGDAGDGRGHGRDDESGRGAGL